MCLWRKQAQSSEQINIWSIDPYFNSQQIGFEPFMNHRQTGDK